jgi:hypothetical protein
MAELNRKAWTCVAVLLMVVARQVLCVAPHCAKTLLALLDIYASQAQGTVQPSLLACLCALLGWLRSML